jgi:hypothetical protein
MSIVTSVSKTRKVENAVWESHDYVSCQEQTSKHKAIKKQRDVNQEYHDDEVVPEY